MGRYSLAGHGDGLGMVDGCRTRTGIDTRCSESWLDTWVCTYLLPVLLLSGVLVRMALASTLVSVDNLPIRQATLRLLFYIIYTSVPPPCSGQPLLSPQSFDTPA
jgi:hypothetical protein